MNYMVYSKRQIFVGYKNFEAYFLLREKGAQRSFSLKESDLGRGVTVDVFDEGSKAGATVHHMGLKDGDSFLLVFVARHFLGNKACVDVVLGHLETLGGPLSEFSGMNLISIGRVLVSETLSSFGVPGPV